MENFAEDTQVQGAPPPSINFFNSALSFNAQRNFFLLQFISRSSYVLHIHLMNDQDNPGDYG
jgi:hypothetical protein